MPHFLDALATGPWVLALVFIVAGLDAVLPFMPSETTVVAAGVVAAATGRPHLGLLIAAAAVGAYAGDLMSYRIGRRSNRAVAARTARGRRVEIVHDWVHRMLHGRGGLIIVAARYVPGGRSTTAFAAGVVRYPTTRFRWYTGLGVLIWATQAALLGYLGGALFADRPILGLALGGACAVLVSSLAVAASRLGRRGPVDRSHSAAPVVTQVVSGAFTTLTRHVHGRAPAACVTWPDRPSLTNRGLDVSAPSPDGPGPRTGPDRFRARRRLARPPDPLRSAGASRRDRPDDRGVPRRIRQGDATRRQHLGTGHPDQPGPESRGHTRPAGQRPEMPRHHTRRTG